MTSPVVSATELNAVLETTRFLAGYSLHVSTCDAGQCDLVVPFKAEFERPGGIVSGMTIMGAADVAMWLAIMTMRGTAEHWVTSDMKTAFLRAGIAEELTCKARILKLARRAAYGTVETFGATSGLLAHHVISYAKTPEPAQ